MALDKPLAETVGKRLERQAQKVRDDCADASARAAQQRYAARSDATAPGLPRRLAAIDEMERLMLMHPRTEVYVGFHELDGLIPSSDSVAPDGNGAASAPAAEPVAEPVAAPVAAAAPAPAAVSAGPAPAIDVVGQYDLACELHKELVAKRAELQRTRQELLDTQRELREQRRVAESEEDIARGAMHMVQDALKGAADQLSAARKRLRDPDEDNPYLEVMFGSYSYIDRDQFIRARTKIRKEWDKYEDGDSAEIYRDLAEESWDELLDRSQDPIRRNV